MYSYLAAERTSAASRKRRAAERATQNGRMAVQDFLRDTKVGCMVSLAPPVEGSEAEEEVPGPPGPDRLFFFPLSFLCFSFLSLISFSADLG